MVPVLCATAVTTNLVGCLDSSGSAAEKGTDTQAPKAEAGAKTEKNEVAGIEKGEGGSDSTDEELIIYSPLTESMIDSMLAMFEGDIGIDTECLAMGIGGVLKRIRTEADDPQADILWSGIIGTVKNKGEYSTDYVTSNEDAFYGRYKNTEGNLTRFDTILSVTMMNTDLIDDIKIEGYEDLLSPELKGKIVFADPAASSPSFEHLVNILYTMGGGAPDNDWDYVKQFYAQLDGKLSGGSSVVYRGIAGGEYAVGLTFEQGSAQYVDADAPVRTAYTNEGVIFRGDGVYTVKNCPNESNVQKFVDWLTSKDIQESTNNTQYRGITRKDVEAGDAMVPVDQVEAAQDNETDTAIHESERLDEFRELLIE